MRSALRLVLLGALLGALAACGKLGPPDTPPGSTYPRGYPAGAALSTQNGTLISGEAGGTAPASKTIAGPGASNGPAFTANGAWIDPDMHRTAIDPNADLDKWHLNANTGN